MYFAFDQADPMVLTGVLQEQFLAAHSQTAQSAPTRWFAVVDGAFDHGRRALSWQLPVARVYEATTLDSLKALSPYLAALPAPQDADFEKYVRQLMRHCSGRPMLSFIACTVDADELCASWQRCLMLQTQGETEPYLLRFADTRVLPAVATLPNQDLWSAFTKTVTQWLMVDRTGALLELQIEPSQTPEHTENTENTENTDDTDDTDDTNDQMVELTDEDLSHLLKSGQADTVICAIEDQLPELLPERQRSQFHKRVEVACELAAEHQIDAFPDVVALAVAGQLTDVGIYEDAALLKLLAERRWTSGQLNDALIEFLPEEAL